MQTDTEGGRKKEEKERRRMRGGQHPQSQIKALSLPSASAFGAPARIERRLTLQLSLGVIVQKERAQAQERDRQRGRGDRQTSREGEGSTMPQTVCGAKLSELDMRKTTAVAAEAGSTG